MGETPQNPIKRHGMPESTVAIILAGGSEGEFGALTRRRAKAALPFGGMFRIFDFSISCLSQSQVDKVGVIIQHLPAALIEHIGVGETWDFNGYYRLLKIMPPFLGIGEAAWYKGTADALYQNMNFIRRFDPENVLLCYGEHLYHIDFDAVIQYHHDHNADLTIVAKNTPLKLTSARLCRLVCDPANPARVVDCARNTERYQQHPVATGIYVIKTKVLERLLKQMLRDRTGHSLSANIIAVAPDQHRVLQYPLHDYWNELNSLDEYFQASMSLLKADPPIVPQEWRIITNPDDRNLGHRTPAFVSEKASVADSILCPGCKVLGQVERSILSPGVVVEEGARVSNSIIMHDAIVKRNATLRYVIADKDIAFAEGGTYGVEFDPNTQQKPKLTLFGRDEQSVTED
ncbi:hypothetical protein JXA32_09715 [Candidatus Sumerlaeota bacterium]|nr:hypothetical protein [Candidatus Sumerlaeota bacterium]